MGGTARLGERMITTAEMAALFSDHATIGRILDFEAALARALAAAGLCGADEAAVIAAACDADLYDADRLAEEGARAGTVVIPLVKALTGRVAAAAPDAAAHVHRGATSQDAIDTGLVLQLRDAVAVLDRDLARAADAAAVLVRTHRSTLMLGRTLLQPGGPTTFGLKAAGWMAAIDAARLRVRRAAEDALVLQFGGAVGTLGSLEGAGIAVAEALAGDLGLPCPPLPWHSRRDDLAALAAAVTIGTGTLAKVGRDVSLLMQYEVSEAAEPGGGGRGGSSAMPHKRNPTASMIARAAAARASGLLATLTATMDHEQERAVGGWQAEWAVWPALMEVAAGAAAATVETLEGLRVDDARMSRNLAALNGVVLSERLALALAARLGKGEAHALVETLTRRAVADGRPLRDVAGETAAVADRLAPAELDALFDPRGALGAAEAFVDRALAARPTADGPGAAG